MDEYTIRGREIYSGRGKLVATLDDDGNPVMAPGMAGPHSAKVKAFLGGQGAERGADTAGGGNVPLRNVAPASLGGLDRNSRSDNGAPRNTEADVRPETREATVEDIPEDRLPPFSPEFGTATPGFAEFVARHRITPDQIAALVKRCENRKP